MKWLYESASASASSPLLDRSCGYYSLLLLCNRKWINEYAYGLVSGSSPLSDMSCGYYKLVLLHNTKRRVECVSASASVSSPLSDRSYECDKLQLLLNWKRDNGCFYVLASLRLSWRSCEYYVLLLLCYRMPLHECPVALASASSLVSDSCCGYYRLLLIRKSNRLDKCASASSRFLLQSILIYNTHKTCLSEVTNPKLKQNGTHWFALCYEAIVISNTPKTCPR